MSDPFLAEIRIFAGDFAPKGWALCNGQLMAISQNTALYSLLGITYGGDGRSTFGLPNLQGSAPMQQGQGTGLSTRYLGETGGEPQVTLLQSEMAMHTHDVHAANSPAQISSPQPSGGFVLGRSSTNVYGAPGSAMMMPAGVGVTGGTQPHNNMQPYLAMSFIIALQGIFPQRP